MEDELARHRAFGVALAQGSGLHNDGSIGQVLLAAMVLISAHDAQYTEGPRTLDNMPITVEYICKLIWVVRSKT